MRIVKIKIQKDAKNTEFQIVAYLLLMQFLVHFKIGRGRMFDIHFYEKTYELKQQLAQGSVDGEEAFKKFEEYRGKKPVVFETETTNMCNMKCVMCPRTTKMTRPITTMPMDMFQKVADQLKPWSNIEWENWQDFVYAKYKVYDDEMSENHFFLFVIPKAVVLHGYGEPLLDKHIVERVQYLTDKNIPTYFSCNSCNLTGDIGERLLEAGVGYLKFSTDSPSDFSVKQIRGRHADFTESYKKILHLLDVKKENGYGTVIVITMLNLVDRPSQQREYRELYKKFEGQDVYIYFKSQNALWLSDGNTSTNKSIHWTEPCQLPWSSLSIACDGSVTACHVDVNNELTLGNVASESLYDIWNGIGHLDFRKKHLSLTEHKCTKECDMKLIGEYRGD